MYVFLHIYMNIHYINIHYIETQAREIKRNRDLQVYSSHQVSFQRSVDLLQLHCFLKCMNLSAKVHPYQAVIRR